MSNTTITPNMGLIVPTVGADPSPDWAENTNADWNIIDQHDHSSGKGLPVTPSGLSINSDLAINSNNLTLIRAARFSPQASPIANSGADVGEVYVSGNELYYNDATGGNQVQITSNGSVNSGAGSISGLPSGTASASFAAGTFTWQSATSTAANMDAASYIFRNASAGSHKLTLAPPGAMASDISLVLPSIPASQKIMSLDASGNMSASYAVDGSTIVISANVIQVPTGGITSTQLASASVTSAKLATNLNLPGDAVQEDGKNLIVSSTNASTSLALIRGLVDVTGAVSLGEGFTSVRNSTGNYTVTFSNAFSDLPIFVATINGTSVQTIIEVSSTSTTTANLRILNFSGTLTNEAFYFIAIGQR